MSGGQRCTAHGTLCRDHHRGGHVAHFSKYAHSNGRLSFSVMSTGLQPEAQLVALRQSIFRSPVLDTEHGHADEIHGASMCGGSCVLLISKQ